MTGEVVRPQILVRDVTKSFSGRVVVDVDELVLGDVPVEGLLGPNGAGKTTLMRLIMHSIPLDGGTVSLSRPGQRDVVLSSTRTSQMAGLGVVKSTQVITDFEHLTILDSALLAVTEARYERPFAAATDRAVRKRHEDEIRHWLDYFGFHDPLAVALSGGDKKLLDIVRCLLLQPAVLLLDEPTAGLSEDRTERVKAAVRQLASTGTSVVIVEHDLDVIWDLCDEVIFMAEGRVLLKDDPATIRANPTVVESYLGAGSA
ncbi:MAG: ABC transporter ATP-binding protein [Acidimicrobiia bacterium]|nr:ABC transporter ATP-binding protein [Acidimicrobiia bacterium]